MGCSGGIDFDLNDSHIVPQKRPTKRQKRGPVVISKKEREENKNHGFKYLITKLSFPGYYRTPALC